MASSTACCSSHFFLRRVQAEARCRAATEHALVIERRAAAELAAAAGRGRHTRLLPTLAALRGSAESVALASTLHPVGQPAPTWAPSCDAPANALSGKGCAATAVGQRSRARMGALQVPGSSMGAHAPSSAGPPEATDASSASTLSLDVPHAKTGAAAACSDSGVGAAPLTDAGGECGGGLGALDEVGHSGSEAVHRGHPSLTLTLAVPSDGSVSEYASAVPSPFSASASTPRSESALPSPRAAAEHSPACHRFAPGVLTARAGPLDLCRACEVPGGVVRSAAGSGDSMTAGFEVWSESGSAAAIMWQPEGLEAMGGGRDGRPGAALRAAEAEAAAARLSAALTAAGQRVKAREEQCRRLQAQLGHAQLRLVRYLPW